MTKKVYPSLSDFENFSRVRTEESSFANDFDYRNVVVNKPWGYEYLWFQNEYVAIWFLYLGEGHSTSLHCHPKKRTSLIVLDGKVQCTTLEDKYEFATLDSIVLEPCVFHSTRAISPAGAYIMEIETPPMKGDLVRMNDSYGRQSKSYENANEYSKEFDKYKFIPFYLNDSSVWNFQDVSINLSQQAIQSFDLIVSVSDKVKLGGRIILDCGEVCDKKDILPVNTKLENQFLIFSRKKQS